MDNTKSFYIRAFGLTIIVEIISIAWWFFMPPVWVTPFLPFLPMFFLATTILIHKGFLSSLNLNPQQFVTRYMLITTIKLLSFLAILFIYAVTNKEDALPFLLSFFVQYLIYSAFEAVEAIKLNKKK